jgi:GNAT superfamily N-acetyltransferase
MLGCAEPRVPCAQVPELLKVRRLGEADADSIAEFHRASWNSAATPDSVRQAISDAADNPFQPGIASPTVGVFVGTRLVAYLGSIPTRFWNGKEFAAAHWLKGFWVLEEYRNGPVGFLLLKEMLKHVGLAASMPAALVPRKLSAALGMRDLGAVGNYIDPVRPARMLLKLDFASFDLKGLSAPISIAIKIARIPLVAHALGAVVSLGLGALRLPAALSNRRLTTQLSERLPSEASLDSLWMRAQRLPACSATRSGAYLRWRYERGSSAQYYFASVWRADELVGVAVLAHPLRRDDARIGGVGIGSVVDLVLDPDCPGALPRLMGAARRWAKTSNYDALLMTASYRALHRPLIRAGYVPTPGNIHVLLRDPGAKYGLSTDLGAWMVTRGDAWSDHV